MKLDQLIHFYETAKQQHIGKAAAIMRISPSGISYSIECLERDLGTKLFEKVGRRIFLTEAGKRLLQKIPQVTTALNDLKSFVAEDTPSHYGHYRIGSSHGLCEHFLTPKISEFFFDNEKASFDIFSLRSAQVIEQTLEGHLDIGVCFSPQEHPKLTSRVLAKGQLKIYVRSGHPLLTEKRPWSHLSEYSAVMPKAFSGIDVCVTHEMFDEFQINFRHRVAFDNYMVGLSAVQNSDDWGFFPEWVEDTPKFKLKPITLPSKWKAPYNISVVWKKDNMLDPAIPSMLERL